MSSYSKYYLISSRGEAGQENSGAGVDADNAVDADTGIADKKISSADAAKESGRDYSLNNSYYDYYYDQKLSDYDYGDYTGSPARK